LHGRLANVHVEPIEAAPPRTLVGEREKKFSQALAKTLHFQPMDPTRRRTEHTVLPLRYWGFVCQEVRSPAKAFKGLSMTRRVAK